jgi:hypothetical protein
LKPLTGVKKLSYIEHLKLAGRNDELAEANVFVSHSWAGLFLTLVDSLAACLRGEEGDAYFWIDLFCCSQHTLYDRDFAKWLERFKPRIAGLRTVLSLSYSDQFAALTRSWVLYELYCAVEAGGSFQVAMSPAESARLLQALPTELDAVLPRGTGARRANK